MTEKQIYLDFNASTPLAPEVVEAMRPLLTEHFGNPSTHHWAGAPTKAAVERARAQVAALLGCDPDEIVLTSGGTESNNHAVKGVFFANRDRGNHVVTSAVEHPAILRPLRFLETLGAKVTVLPVDRHGRVDPEDVRKALTPRTILVSLMHAVRSARKCWRGSPESRRRRGPRATQARSSSLPSSRRCTSLRTRAWGQFGSASAGRRHGASSSTSS